MMQWLDHQSFFMQAFAGVVLAHVIVYSAHLLLRLLWLFVGKEPRP